MKKILPLILVLLQSFCLDAQNMIHGRLVDGETGKPVAGGQVSLGSQIIVSGNDGVFALNSATTGKLNISVSVKNYETLSTEITIAATNNELGDFVLKPVPVYNAETGGLSEVTQSSLDYNDESKGQFVSGLLHSAGDVFSSTASYTLSPMYFRIRGYDGEYSSVYIDGINVNDPENGRPSWSEWGGLNDVIHNKEVANGIEASDFAFGSLGGSTNISTRASLYRKQNKMSYAWSNRAYHNRLMYTYSTGLMKNNWAFTLSGSRRWAEEGYVPGTFYDSWSYFVSAEKVFNMHHSLNFTLLGSPTRRGMQSSATQETYDLTGDHYYNANWGYQDGEKRNARVRNVHEPMFILSHLWKPGEKTRINTAVDYSFGRNGTTALNWYNANDPRPDYYRYLPSYQTDPLVKQAVTDVWLNNPANRQINWNKLYQANFLANLAGQQARYIIEERRQDHQQLDFSFRLNQEMSKTSSFAGGLQLSTYAGYHFKVLTDLLGADKWVDIDQFAQRDFPDNPTLLQNDLFHPGKTVLVGDRFGYDYVMHQNTGQLWGQFTFNTPAVDYFVAANLSFTSYWREGRMANGRAPLNSFGDSPVQSFNNYGIKGGITYKISGKHFLSANAAYMSEAPLSNNAYISPSIKSIVQDGLSNETILSGDISYITRNEWLNMRLTAYQTYFKNQVDLKSYYDDIYLTYVNLSLNGIDKVHQGVEFGAEIKATPSLSAVLVASVGNYIYTSRPNATLSIENGSKPDTNFVVYTKNYYVGGTPQTAGSLGIKYAGPKFWYFNANLNYFSDMYLDINPERHTTMAISNLGYGDPLIEKITQQEKVAGGMTLDASIGKSFKVKQYTFNLNFSISNILDNQDLISGGYEQLRFDFATKNVGKFPPKVFYSFGRTYYISLAVRI